MRIFSAVWISPLQYIESVNWKYECDYEIKLNLSLTLMTYISVLNKYLWPVSEAWIFAKAFQLLQTITGLVLFDEAG